jgi:hypothetical protein
MPIAAKTSSAVPWQKTLPGLAVAKSGWRGGVENEARSCGFCWLQCLRGGAQSEQQPNLVAINAPGTGQPGDL